TTGITAEAVPTLLLRIDEERGVSFTMEWA
ncbi:unnamed protein product, partial [marine sediment metagenome]